MTKYGKRVKRSRGLYKKKKSGFGKFIRAALFTAVLSGLVFVGYVVARAIMNYSPPDDPVTEPPAVTDIPLTAGEIDTDVSATDTPPPVANGGKTLYAPTNVLSSTTSLSSFLNTAKADGYDSVAIEMKDDEGHLLYKSGIKIGGEELGGSIVTGSLTAEQIAKACTDAGLSPAARVNTLKDHIAHTRIQDVNYKGWFDNVPGIGKPWANPFFPGTRAYAAEITAELRAAGFEEIICVNTVFPKEKFYPADLGILPAEVTNLETRYTGLGEFISAARADGEVFSEVLLGDVADPPVRTAELLRNRDKLESKVILAFAKSDFPEADDRGIRSDIAQTAANGLARTEKYVDKKNIVPMLDRSGFSSEDFEEVIRAFRDLGYENYVIRN